MTLLPPTYLVVVLAAIMLGAHDITGSVNSDNATEASLTPMTAELLIVCDKDFGDYFQHDRQKIIDYWAIHLWDINMKFKTLQKVYITFRVTQIITFKSTEEQPFIEEAKTGNMSQFLNNLLPKFSKWVYKQADNLTKFDISILATQAATPGSFISYHKKCACRRKCSAVIHFDNPWARYCSLLEQPLAILLGARWDHTTKFGEGCSLTDYIMNINRGCGNKRFFFSKCTDEDISKYVNSEDGNCLRSSEAPTDDVIRKLSKVTHPPSLDEQCAMIIGNGTAAVPKSKDRCVRAECNRNDEFFRNFFPFDNSPCGQNKFCFRGRCLRRGYQIRNVGTGTCLHMRNRLASDDYLQMSPCVESATLLNQFIIVDKFIMLDHFIYKDSPGLYIVSPYSTADASENTLKCLTLDATNDTLRYVNCRTAEADAIRWNLTLLTGGNQEFMLYNFLNITCTFVDDDNNIRLNATCDGTNEMMRWKFYEDINIPAAWFNRSGVDSVKSISVSPRTNGYASEITAKALSYSTPNANVNETNEDTTSPYKESLHSSTFTTHKIFCNAAAENLNSANSVVQGWVLAVIILVILIIIEIVLFIAVRIMKRKARPNDQRQDGDRLVVSFTKQNLPEKKIDVRIT